MKNLNISNLKIGKIMKHVDIDRAKSIYFPQQKGMRTILEANISEEDKVKILSELFTFNHGNVGCYAFEYCANAGQTSNGGGDFRKFKQNLLFFGYDTKVTYRKRFYRLLDDHNKYLERISSEQPLPTDIESIIISDHNGQEIDLFESPDTLEYLACSGDKRAIETYNNFMYKLGAKQIISLDENGKAFYKKRG